ncbi:hypothetical protein NKI31_20245 [Mesorhizobium sp. M0659]|uniref:hypothetical protein n=1 Tax=unclassified Mesorhizobium TaxID=325217 RepID=UPI0003CFA125|nr:MULTISPECIES: hypothetical protein [unclassified Mesorhizobium]ESZ02733.1 hypothetical protein X736_29215 [Mesorhizobium sp. L2C089B000]ESZ51689.1 hypothetical protein X731_03625 [Mesorhizobium sp. L2C054A000]WJI50537.1 hypothetical protein NLY44_29220 [Mesorhizobium sp. C089B]
METTLRHLGILLSDNAYRLPKNIKKGWWIRSSRQHLTRTTGVGAIMAKWRKHGVVIQHGRRPKRIVRQKQVK